MIKYFNGTVFNADVDAIVNTVNTVGVMGAGLALECALRYPKMYISYKQKCDEKNFQIGELIYYQENNKTIINFPTKRHFKYPSKIEWIEMGLQEFVRTYKHYNLKAVAFPKLGTLNGGLSWDTVKRLMERYLEPLDIIVYICLDNISEAQGKEADMVAILNSLDIAALSLEIKLTNKQIEALKTVLPVRRFWQLKEVEGIGITTYTKIFNYCYNNKRDKQISLFDGME